MRSRKGGRRHLLLLYKHTMDRLWLPTLILGLVMALVWWFASVGDIPALQPPRDMWVFMGALVVLAFTLFSLLARNMSYVQAKEDHLRVVTPFLRLKISYRRFISGHPEVAHEIFPPTKLKKSERRFISPFYAHTAVVIKINEFPLPQSVLRLFLSNFMFTSKFTGFVFLVQDWIALSMEIDNLYGIWRDAQFASKQKPTGFMRGMYKE